MEFFIENIHKARHIVETKDPEFFHHIPIPNNEITDDTISILMTAHNRSKQFYFTLGTILQSKIKNIHIIIVDDSDKDPIDPERLRSYPFSFDFVSVHRDKKFWHNPCINYNIGFQYIKGSKIILQNSEVCHVGDVLQYVHEHLQKGQYQCFEVISSLNEKTNEDIYSMSPLSSFYQFHNHGHLFYGWYQHHTYRPKHFHFLTAFCKMDVSGFSYDFGFGSWYDDDDLVLQITHVHSLHIVDVHCDKTGVGGIHLYHGREWEDDVNNAHARYFNKSLLYAKTQYLKYNQEYCELSRMSVSKATRLLHKFGLF